MDELRIDYGAMMDSAFREVVRKAFALVADEGMPNGHSLYVTFPTDGEGVRMPDWLRAEHPETLSIVLEYEYYDLVVDDEGFEVDLRFDSRPARLRVPFRAVSVFADPEARFGLSFKGNAESEDAPEAEAQSGTFHAGHAAEAEESAAPEEDPSDGSNVIPFDSFRRR